ncbi:MAG: hypothetical protein HY364_00260 [Candidatus Aenigmarchaeota archaeon]|nr:hypothetical protein [Candidatus Aenigmarchaeota archaeon]
MKIALLFPVLLPVILVACMAYPAMAEDAGDTPGKMHMERLKNLNNDRINALDESSKKNLNRLNDRALDKIERLGQEKIEKLASLEKSGMRRVASLNQERLNSLTDLDRERLEKLARLGNAKIEEFSRMDSDVLREKIDSITVHAVSKERLIRARPIDRASLADAKERVETSKNLLLSARDQVADRIAELRAAKSEIAACRESNVTGCEATRQKSIENAKIIVAGSADKAIEALKKTKARIESSEFIDASAAEDAIADIDLSIGYLESAKERAQSAETSEQLKEAALEIKAVWNMGENSMKLHASLTARSHADYSAKRLLHAEKRLDQILSYADQNGIDTSLLEPRAAEFSSAVEKARAKAEDARKTFDEARTARQDALADGNISADEKASVKSLIERGVALLKESNTAAKDAHIMLLDIAKTIRESYKEIKVTESQIVNAEDELPEEIGEPEAVEIIEE